MNQLFLARSSFVLKIKLKGVKHPPFFALSAPKFEKSAGKNSKAEH